LKNQLFKLNCITITNINIINQSKFCYNDIPIKFVLETSNQSEIKEIQKEGFLNADGFIVDHSATKECEEHFRYINLNGSEVTIVSNKNNYKIFETKNIKYETIDVLSNNLKAKQKHIDSLVNGVNYIAQFDKIQSINDDDGTWFIKNTHESISHNEIQNDVTAVK